MKKSEADELSLAWKKINWQVASERKERERISQNLQHVEEQRAFFSDKYQFFFRKKKCLNLIHRRHDDRARRVNLWFFFLGFFFFSHLTLWLAALSWIYNLDPAREMILRCRMKNVWAHRLREISPTSRCFPWSWTCPWISTSFVSKLPEQR